MALPVFAPPCALPSRPFVAPPEMEDGRVRRHPIVIVGAGLAGLALACDPASRGVEAVVLDEDDTVGVRGASRRRPRGPATPTPTPTRSAPRCTLCALPLKAIDPC